MKKEKVIKILRSVLVLMVAVGVAAVLIRLKPKPKKLPPPPATLLVEVMGIKASSHVVTINSYGTVRPRESLNLVSEVKGKIVEVATNFEEGGFFRKDELLIRIDPRSYELVAAQKEKQLKQIDAEIRLLAQEKKNLEVTLKIAWADMELARADWERFKTLVKEGVVGKASQDQAEQKYLSSRNKVQEIKNQIALIDPRADQLKAQRELIEVQLKDALLDLDRTEIKAPFDGWVLEKEIEKEQFVNAGAFLGRIYNASTLEVEVNIPFKDLFWLGESKNAKDFSGLDPMGNLTNTPIRARIKFQSPGQTHTWDGHLVRIKAQVDEKTRTLPLIIAVPTANSMSPSNSGYSLKPGMFVNVELIGRRLDSTFLLPRSAIHPGDLVYLANDKHLTIRSVEVLQRLNNSVYVGQGLQDGDLVITTPVSIPKEGVKLSFHQSEQNEGPQK
jgi:RND family efflux transporter MFP subunit